MYSRNEKVCKILEKTLEDFGENIYAKIIKITYITYCY